MNDAVGLAWSSVVKRYVALSTGSPFSGQYAFSLTTRVDTTR